MSHMNKNFKEGATWMRRKALKLNLPLAEWHTRKMNSNRIKEIQEGTAYPNSVSVQQGVATLQRELN